MIRYVFQSGTRLTASLIACGVAALFASGTARAAMPASLTPKRSASPASMQIQLPTRRWVRYPPVPAQLSPQAALGKQIFFDASLSASGKMACASCHSPEHAYGPPNGLAVQLGGPGLNRPGKRTVPSLRYLTFTPMFTRHYYFPGSEDTEDEGPTGGFMRDGRYASLREQAGGPMLDANEMANASRAAVVDKVQRGAYADVFRLVFGAQALADVNAAFDRIGVALEAFETEDASFHPYTSKFDSVMSGNAEFTAGEKRGYLLYNNPLKGNCAKCHFDQPGPGGRPAQFSDFQFASLGVPRNMEIPWNRNPKYYDMGMCGPNRSDLAKETDYCGLFKDPTLRNVATRSVFFHNGRFHSLEDVLHFYFERDTDAAKWYPKKNGKLVRYDDLPPRYRDNVDALDPPFLNQKPGAQPALSDAEMRDLIAFLKTLNDGYSSMAGGPAVQTVH